MALPPDAKQDAEQRMLGAVVGVPALGREFRIADLVCFALQDAGTIGNAGRSIGTSPGYVSTDFSLTKDTRISERVSAQLRAELFNIFNHTNLGLPAAGAFTSTGVAANAGAITNIIGNSRQIQFGLKLLF